MEQSAFEAVITGVNSFIFALSLTFGIMLMTNVLGMVNAANDTTMASEGSLIDSMGIVEERIIKGSDLLTYYRKSEASSYKYYVKRLNQTNLIDLKQYVETQLIDSYISAKFKIIYNGQEQLDDSTYETYVFEMQ